MKTQHTPGPWIYCEKTLQVGKSSQNGYRLLANLCDRENLSLIAAAPELLEALEAVMALPANEPARIVLLLPQIKAAIAKAKGQ